MTTIRDQCDNNGMKENISSDNNGAAQAQIKWKHERQEYSGEKKVLQSSHAQRYFSFSRYMYQVKAK